MHKDWKRNVTTNESIRKKWNASKQRKEMSADQVSWWEKVRYLYWEPLPRSRLEHWYKLRKETVRMAKQARDNSQVKVEHAVDTSIQSDDSREELKRQQKELLKLVDNYEILCSYGIDTK